MTTLPKRMILEVTKRCNYRCSYCYCIWHERPDLVGDELDAQGWRDIIQVQPMMAVYGFRRWRFLLAVSLVMNAASYLTGVLLMV